MEAMINILTLRSRIILLFDNISQKIRNGPHKAIVDSVIFSRSMARNNVLNVSQNAKPRFDICALLQIMCVEYFCSIACRQFMKIEKKFKTQSHFDQGAFRYFDGFRKDLVNYVDMCSKKENYEDEQETGDFVREFLGYELYLSILLKNVTKTKKGESEANASINSHKIEGGLKQLKGDMEHNTKKWDLLLEVLKVSLEDTSGTNGAITRTKRKRGDVSTANELFEKLVKFHADGKGASTETATSKKQKTAG